MNVLLVSPRYPDTFWSLRYALQFTSAKATIPPLGLLTVAGLLPVDWAKTLVDMNVEELTDEHLAWADVVFISAMTIQSASAEEVIQRCRRQRVKVVAGGPHFTHFHEQIEGVDHFVLGEAEETLPVLVRDLSSGRAEPIYRADNFPDLDLTPPPRWELIDFNNYTTMPIQTTRGCPYDCEFCDVVYLFGRRPRHKTPARVLAELEGLYRAGWRGDMMLVDDNFIGHKTKAAALLEDLITWQTERKYPLTFLTQASLDLADNPRLMSIMAEAGINRVFIGLETPAAGSLEECQKRQNQNRDMIEAVRTIQRAGLEVLGGFILGFDSDPPSIFEDMAGFIQEAGIPTAMVGLLSAMPGTRLWERLEREGRLLGLPSGDNVTDVSALNMKPKMGRERLVKGYASVMEKLYEPKAYYDRVLTLFKLYTPNENLPRQRVSLKDLASALRIFWRLGFKEQGRRDFWRFMARVLTKHRRLLPQAVVTAVCGYHFWKISRRFIRQVENFQEEPKVDTGLAELITYSPKKG